VPELAPLLPLPVLEPAPLLPVFGAELPPPVLGFGTLTLTLGAGWEGVLTFTLVVPPPPPPPNERSGPVNRYQAMTASTASTIKTVIRLIPAAAVRSPESTVSIGCSPGGGALTLI
jgi:hypothetical protein